MCIYCCCQGGENCHDLAFPLILKGLNMFNVVPQISGTLLEKPRSQGKPNCRIFLVNYYSKGGSIAVIGKQIFIFKTRSCYVAQTGLEWVGSSESLSQLE